MSLPSAYAYGLHIIHKYVYTIIVTTPPPLNNPCIRPPTPSAPIEKNGELPLQLTRIVT